MELANGAAVSRRRISHLAVEVGALLQNFLGVESNSRSSAFLARTPLFLTTRSRASSLLGDCSKPLAIKRRNIFPLFLRLQKFPLQSRNRDVPGLLTLRDFKGPVITVECKPCGRQGELDRKARAQYLPSRRSRYNTEGYRLILRLTSRMCGLVVSAFAVHTPDIECIQ
jgi:hypothetical protein